jgi:hypothetical protein
LPSFGIPCLYIVTHVITGTLNARELSLVLLLVSCIHPVTDPDYQFPIPFHFDLGSFDFGLGGVRWDAISKRLVSRTSRHLLQRHRSLNVALRVEASFSRAQKRLIYFHLLCGLV